MKSLVQSAESETLSDPRDRLTDIKRESDPARRDRRLIRLVSELLRNDTEDAKKDLDLASDAISGFSDPEAKSAYLNLLLITRIDSLVKKKRFIEAQEVAASISSEEMSAWALLALASVATKSDRVLGFEMISNALRSLDKASPGPYKVQLALSAVAMIAKSDPQRAFETFQTASRYANSSVPEREPTKTAYAFGLKATIGEAHVKLGVFPASLGELKIDPSLSALALTDWYRADHIAGDIREPALRLQLKLQLAGAMLARGPKPSQKEATPKSTRGAKT